MREVLYIQQYGDSLLVNGINDNGVKAQKLLIDVRCAVIPPIETYPGYYLFFGMQKEANAYGKHPLLFLYEKEDSIQSDLLDNLADDTGRLKCSTVYAQFHKKQRNSQGFYRDLWDYRRHNNLPFKVVQAVSSEDYEYGRAILRNWLRDKAVIRPRTVQTILDSQIKSDSGMVETSDITEPRWYAFHAIRYLIAGYIKNPPQEVQQTTLGLWGDKYDSQNILSNQNKSGGSLSAWT